MKKKTPIASEGNSAPLGATIRPNGVNFSIFSKNATAVELLLFDESHPNQVSKVFPLNPLRNKTFYYWHIFISNIGEGQRYGYRIHGPNKPKEGLRFDPEKVILDPYAKAVDMSHYSRIDAIRTGDNSTSAIRAVVLDGTDYDWEGDRCLKHPFSKTIIYEMHVGGFTKHPSSGLANHLKGTYKGLVEKIPYLQSLGITSVELLPVLQFDADDVPDQSLTNYWGYSPIALFVPHAAYSSSDDPLEVIREFKDMVKALHKAGIEVILDVVFNHTAEGNEHGPMISFKGIENRAYYMLEEDKRYYRNYSGTGNTLNGNHSIVRRLIVDCLRYWVSEMHIDGFRFDLASVLSRDEDGHPIENPPILWEIESDPVLASTKIIAEAWDLGQYQLGSFIGDKWAEWNGMFRDDIRRFVKSDANQVGKMADRILASQQLFGSILRDPNRSINFVTCHDGFTMNDLVSYNYKHNHANGEDNRDGHNDNHSWNCGVEGLTENAAIHQLRTRQMKNFYTLLMMSQGTPMILMGDEIANTQSGNNNTYCQDNEMSWLNWDTISANKDLLTFVKKIIQLNLQTAYFQEENFWGEIKDGVGTNIHFHGTSLFRPDWSKDSRTLVYSLDNPNYPYQLFIIANAYWEPIKFDVFYRGIKEWKKVIDTYQEHPNDISEPENAPIIEGNCIEVAPRTTIVLWGNKE